MAFNSVPFLPQDVCIRQILAALSLPHSGVSPEETNKRIEKLASITQRNPAEVFERAQAIFSQEGWVAHGPVYQAGGNIIINQPPDKPSKPLETWIKVVGLIATLLGIVVSGITIYKHFHPPEPLIKSEAPSPKIPLRGIVITINDAPVVDATVSLNTPNGRTVTTTPDGGFYFGNISGSSGDRVRLYVKKQGFQSTNEYVTLPGPAKIRLEKQ